MKTKRLISCVLVVAMLCSLFTTVGYAEQKKDIYVNLGDSVAWGDLENSDQYPDFDRNRDTYSARLARYLGAQRVDYSGCGMQTTDIMYMLDEQFRSDVDSGVLTPDYYFRNEYPPHNGTSLDEVESNITNAKYISICAGSCDWIVCPGDHANARVDELMDRTEGARQKLQELRNGGKLDAATFKALNQVLKADGQAAVIYLMMVVNMVEGLADYAKYYPMIMKHLREMNPTATIFVVGKYIPDASVSFLTDRGSTITKILDRLVDNYNLISKNAAAEYNCLYVDTMGVDTVRHPTPTGHTQIFERMKSVLEGERTYAGNVELVAALTGRMMAHISKQLANWKGLPRAAYQ